MTLWSLLTPDATFYPNNRFKKKIGILLSNFIVKVIKKKKKKKKKKAEVTTWYQCPGASKI